MRYDFSDPQSGKDVCDGKIAPMKTQITAYVSEKHNATNAAEMKTNKTKQNKKQKQKKTKTKTKNKNKTKTKKPETEKVGWYQSHQQLSVWARWDLYVVCFWNRARKTFVI